MRVTRFSKKDVPEVAVKSRRNSGRSILLVSLYGLLLSFSESNFVTADIMCPEVQGMRVLSPLLHTHRAG